MQAIKTAYFGPTNVRGSCIKASAAAGSFIAHYDHALNLDANHKAAMEALVAKLDWDYGPWIGGTIKTKADSFMVWVCVPTRDERFVGL